MTCCSTIAHACRCDSRSAMSLHGCSSNCPDTQAAGKYVKNCTSSSSGYCVPCPAGTYKVGTSETKSCSVCQWSARKGHYREGCGGTSAGWTEPCPLGTYQPIHLGRWNRLHRRSTGQQACLQCPVGKHSGLRLGASECIDCGQNWPTELDEQCSAASAPTATSEAAAQPGTAQGNKNGELEKPRLRPRSTKQNVLRTSLLAGGISVVVVIFMLRCYAQIMWSREVPEASSELGTSMSIKHPCGSALQTIVSVRDDDCGSSVETDHISPPTNQRSDDEISLDSNSMDVLPGSCSTYGSSYGPPVCAAGDSTVRALDTEVQHFVVHGHGNVYI